MRFIDNKNNYPRFIGDILLANPKWQEGENLPQGWSLVEETDTPIPSDSQKVVENFPTLIENVYFRDFEIVELTKEEIESRNQASSEYETFKLLGLTNTQIEALLGN